LELGRVLGRGGFCVVNEIVRITIKGNEAYEQPKNIAANEKEPDESEANGHEIAQIVQDRSFMSKHYLRGKTNDCRYAIKVLQDSNKKDASTYVSGVVDLAIEARFLSVLQHDHIIKMRAVAACSPFDATNCYFIILDRLYDTLSVRLRTWKKQQPVGVRKMLDRSGKKERSLFLERLSFGFDLSCALDYLHEKR
jgi:hypothetical protein